MGQSQRTSTHSNLSKPPQQFGVHQWLDEAVALGPAETRVRWRHFGKHPALGVEEPQNLIWHGVRQDAVDQTDRLEGAQRLVVESDPTRVVDQRGAILDYQRANTLLTKDIRQSQPDRARADN